jgi:stage IV sporulation protein FB
VRLGRLLGAEVRLDPLLAVVLGGALALGYLPEAALFAAALLLHELGHLVAAAVEDVPVGRLVVHPLGAVAHIPSLPLLERRVALTITLAGPAVSLIMAGLGALVLRHGPEGAAASSRLGLWIDLNVGLGLVNLVPVLPLDGGQAVRAHLAAAGRLGQHGPYLVRAGQALGLAVAAGAALATALGRPFWDVGVFGLWLVLASGREGASLAYGRTVALEARRSALRHGAVLQGRILVAEASVTLGQVWRAMAPRAHHEVRVVAADGRVIATLAEAAVYAGLLRLGPTATLAELLQGPTGGADGPGALP